MRRLNSSVKVDYISETGADSINRTYFAYIPLEDMVCYAAAESYDGDNDINSAKLAVESVLVAFERNPSFRNIKSYIQYAHDQIVANSVKNRLEAAITVVVSDYTRIRYGSCGNIKFYLLSDNAFYLKSETQTYYQYAANAFGVDKAPLEENKNLLQYLGKRGKPKTQISKKTNLPEESTMLFTTRNLWERIDDVEILDVYEESKPEEFVGKLEDLLLLSQLNNPVTMSYTAASLFVEKTYKEDTAGKKKIQRYIIIGAIILLILALAMTIIVSTQRAGDRNAMSEIERLNSEGIRYAKTGNYSMAYEQYSKANELAGKLRFNLQYTKEKRDLTSAISEKWHLFNGIVTGDTCLKNGEYANARSSYLDARNVYENIYNAGENASELLAPDILIAKLSLTDEYIMVDYLTSTGEMYETEELFLEAQRYFIEAEGIVKTIGDLDLRKDLMAKMFGVKTKIKDSVEVNYIQEFRTLMEDAEDKLNYELALEYSACIIEEYLKLGIKDPLAERDRERIERKIELRKETAAYIEKARTAAEESRYEDAMQYYNIVLDMYKEMGLDIANKEYRNIRDELNEVASMEKIIARAEVADSVVTSYATSGSGREEVDAAATGQVATGPDAAEAATTKPETTAAAGRTPTGTETAAAAGRGSTGQSAAGGTLAH
jgi:tetratricopeptide (TPR) repeat protein